MRSLVFLVFPESITMPDVVYFVERYPPWIFINLTQLSSCSGLILDVRAWKEAINIYFYRQQRIRIPEKCILQSSRNMSVTFDASDMLTRCQWRSSNLFSLVIQGDTRTFELTNWLNKVRTLLWCCFLTQFRPQTIRNCLLYLVHFWDLIIGFRVGCL